ncbi:virulence factor TspB C-terminal domain-related protein [Acidithiobacillus ferriphilus]|uniref:virulence factor TspB C-terminal domain-related protein n=1 Tax=Acidithiobacillus ferriphilus TaxID=1689834 RepID=UPI004057BBCA
MDFLPCNLITGAVFGALCLVSLPAFAVLDSPNYSWRQSSNGQVYKVYDPQGAHLSPSLNPSSTFSESSAGAPVIDTAVPGPLTIDGATGEILNGVTLSRSLDAAQLASSASLLLGLSNPYADAFRALTLVGTLAIDAYNAANPSNSPAINSSNPYYVDGCVDPFSPSTLFSSPSAACSGSDTGGSLTSMSGSNPYSCSMSNGSFSVNCNGTGSDTAPSGYGGTSLTPSQAVQWAQANPSPFQSNLVPILNGSTADNLGLARSLGTNNAPLSSPIPYAYHIPSANSSVSGLPTTTSSTDPSTGNTTTIVTTPTYNFSTPSSGNGVQVQNVSKTVTSTCTTSGSCSVINTTTKTSSNSQPKLGSFTAPAVSAPTSSSISPTPFALNLKMPAQSSAICPPPLTYTAFGTQFTIPLSPLCTLATDCRPYVESLGAVGAGIVIFR